MQVKLSNIVDNTVVEDSDFIPSSGLSYFLEFEDKKVLPRGFQNSVTPLLKNIYALHIMS